MEALVYFVLVPGVFGVLQFLIYRSGLSHRAKRTPAVLNLIVGLVCFLGMMGRLPLPETYFFSRHSFLAFPDYWYIGLFCIPALVGLGMGAVIALTMSEGPEQKEKV